MTDYYIRIVAGSLNKPLFVGEFPFQEPAPALGQAVVFRKMGELIGYKLEGYVTEVTWRGDFTACEVTVNVEGDESESHIASYFTSTAWTAGREPANDPMPDERIDQDDDDDESDDDKY